MAIRKGPQGTGICERTYYHPNFLFYQFGMLERCALRLGNVHSANGWRGVLNSVIAWYADRDILRFFHADATYAIPAIYARLEEAGYSTPSGCPPTASCARRSRTG